MVIHEKVYGNKKNYTKWNDGCLPHLVAWRNHWKRCSGSMNRNNGKSKTIRFR